MPLWPIVPLQARRRSGEPGFRQSLAVHGIRTGRTVRDSHHLTGTREALPHGTGSRLTCSALMRDGTSLAHGIRLICLLGSAGAPTRAQQSNTDQQMSFRSRWSSRTSARIASGSWSRCHRHSSRPALSPSPTGAAARAALIA